MGGRQNSPLEKQRRQAVTFFFSFTILHAPCKVFFLTLTYLLSLLEQCNTGAAVPTCATSLTFPNIVCGSVQQKHKNCQVVSQLLEDAGPRMNFGARIKG